MIWAAHRSFADFAERYSPSAVKVTWDTAKDLVLINLSSFSFIYALHETYFPFTDEKVFSIYFMYSILQYHNASDW